MDTKEHPVLPQNVSIFSPGRPATAKALLDGRLFTRLVTVGTDSSQHTQALGNKVGVHDTFLLAHHNVLLLFDSDAEGKDLQDAHHEHFRTVCLMLKDEDINLDFAGCVFDVTDALQAGFQLEGLSLGSVMVVDVMSGGGGSEDDSDSEDDNDDADDDEPDKDTAFHESTNVILNNQLQIK